jgi:hypothetical protein
MQDHFVYQNLKRELVLKKKNRFTPPFYPLKNFTNLKKNKKNIPSYRNNSEALWPKRAE